jgi:predicted RNA-binding protein with RPS1 domain
VDENAVRAAGLERLAAQARITEQMAFRVFQRISAKEKMKLNEIARQYLDGQLAQEQVAAEVALVKRAELANKAVDEIVSGTVVGLADFGAFVDIGIGSDALVHISELADQYVQTPGDIVQVGKTYTFKIISIDKERLHIGLSLRQAKANEAPEPTIDMTIDNLPEPGDVREGIVRNIQHYGAFIDIGIGYNGLLHNTKLPQSTARDVVSIGDTITVRIEHIDPDNKRITLALPEGSTTEQAPVDASGWLTDHGVVVQESRQPADHDAIWDELALEMGDNYLHLEHLLRRMRQQTSRRDNNEFVFRLSDASPQQREAVKHFCNRLHSEYAFLRRYNFYKDTQTIKLAVNLEAMDTHTQFFNGYWFERYVVVSMKNLLESRRIRYDYLLNAHIKWNNGRQNELDVFFLIDAQPLWIECRSGQVADQIERYAAIRRQLGVPRERAVVLGLTVTDKATTTMTQIHDVTVANLTTFPQHVQAVLS